MFILLALPFTSDAAASRTRVDTSDLDKDPVETFPIPILFGVTLANLTPDYADPRGGGTRLHEGQDMRAPLGTPIVSPTEAVVISTGSGASSGKYVYTANPGGEVFRYMHLDTIADIRRGDELDVGDFIGTVGDTGNAPEGVYHLHFEVRDEDNEPTDPYPRLSDESFSVSDKMKFLRALFRDIDEDEEEDYAQFLVSTFTDDFTTAFENNYRVPDAVEEAMEESEIGRTSRLLEQLEQLINSIPKFLTHEMTIGSEGAQVSLLQTWLIFKSYGPAHERLKVAGATGYYGSITSAAVAEWQERQGMVKTTGNWDTASWESVTD